MQLVAASLRMCNLIVRTSDSDIYDQNYCNLDASVNDALQSYRENDTEVLIRKFHQKSAICLKNFQIIVGVVNSRLPENTDGTGLPTIFKGNR